MNASNPNEVTIHLRDYLTPGGRHPYAQLFHDMRAALASGKRVFVISVPGFLMASGDPEAIKQGRKAWYAEGLYYGDEYGVIRGYRGTRSDRLPRPRKPRASTRVDASTSTADTRFRRINGLLVFPVYASDGRTIAHVTGTSYAAAYDDFLISRRAGWYPADATLSKDPEVQS